MENILIETGSYTIIGDRTSQQDAMQFSVKEDMVLAVVCDGMGGMSGGERASREAVNAIFESYERDFEEDEAMYTRWMNRAFVKADEIVSGLTDRDGNVMRGGSTAVIVLVKENRLYWGSVGDSVIYFMDDQGLHTVTRMHNYNLHLEQMMNNGEITREEARAESERGQGEALISFIGVGGLPIIDTGSKPVYMKPGDVVILASDGLYKSLNRFQIQAIVEESGGNMSIAARRLCEEAYRLSTGKQDNTTVIAMQCTGVPERKITSRLEEDQ